MGANSGDFLDGGSAARTNHLGALQETAKFEGPSAATVKFEGTTNSGISSSPQGVASNGNG